MVPLSLIIINACHRTLKTHLYTAVQTEPIFSLLFTILHLSGLWKTRCPVYNCRFAPESPSPEVLSLDLSSVGHLVLPREINFSKSQSSVSMLTRKGQKGARPWLWKQANLCDLLQIYYILLLRVNFIYSSIYSAFIMYKAISRVPEGH